MRLALELSWKEAISRMGYVSELFAQGKVAAHGEMMSEKRCRVCDTELNDGNWRKSHQKGHSYICKKCSNEQERLRRKSNPDKMKEIYTISNRKRGARPFDKNTHCSLFLGVHIAEGVLSQTFKNVKRMPYGNPGYDFICGGGYKVDVKSACELSQIRKSPAWFFNIKKNVITDYFLCIAFDNRQNLNPQHIWLVPGGIVNTHAGIRICESTLSKWQQYEHPIGQVTACCNAMKQKK